MSPRASPTVLAAVSAAAGLADALLLHSVHHQASRWVRRRRMGCLGVLGDADGRHRLVQQD